MLTSGLLTLAAAPPSMLLQSVPECSDPSPDSEHSPPSLGEEPVAAVDSREGITTCISWLQDGGVHRVSGKGRGYGDGDGDDNGDGDAKGQKQ